VRPVSARSASKEVVCGAACCFGWALPFPRTGGVPNDARWGRSGVGVGGARGAGWTAVHGAVRVLGGAGRCAAGFLAYEGTRTSVHVHVLLLVRGFRRHNRPHHRTNGVSHPHAPTPPRRC